MRIPRITGYPRAARRGCRWRLLPALGAALTACAVVAAPVSAQLPVGGKIRAERNAPIVFQADEVEYDEQHKRLEAERENLRERSLLLAQAEQARETLQEQLRRRSEELAARHKAMQDHAARHEAGPGENDG